MTHDHDQPIFLIGFMGSGKSTVGAMIARTMQRRFVDLDRELEQKHGATIAVLFCDGESIFRDKETAALRALSLAGAVIAVGGGTPCASDNLQFMKSAGTVIYLETSADTLRARLGDGEGRPLLQGTVADRIAALLPIRAPIYEQAHIIVTTDDRDARQVADAVMARLAT